MPDIGLWVVLFIAGSASWMIGTLSGATGSIALVAILTYIIRITTIAPAVTVASLMASPARIIVWWRNIDWRVVRWYAPGAVTGAVLGSWIFSWASAKGLDIVVGLFLLSAPIQYRFGQRTRSFPMKVQWFVPVSLTVGTISGVAGASSMISMPFYFNYGLIRERMIATGAVHSLFIQIAKLVTYGSLGVLPTGSIIEGVCAGSGAVFAIVISRHWLERYNEIWFRRMAIMLMAAVGTSLLWRAHDVFG